MNLYPRSFLRLIVLGNIIAALPLLAAVGYASLAIDELVQHSEATVSQASRAAALGYALQEDLDHMDHILLQYQVLRDPLLLDAYAYERREWRHSGDEYSRIALLASLSGRIQMLQRKEAAAYEILGPRAEKLAQLQSSLTSLRRDLAPLMSDANALVDAEREAFRLKSRQLWERLMLAILAALTLTGLLVWVGRRTVERLWSRFERAVLALGEGRLDRRIHLKGPADMQRIGGRLEWLRKRMLALEKDRTRIMRHASHELKTPLATLREGANLLNEGVVGPLTPQQSRIADLMTTSVTRLQELIDGALSMQQASHARNYMETGAIRFDKVIEQTLAITQVAARNRRIHVTGSLAPLVIEGGGEALATLADNLISNAIKFSPDGGTVQVTLARAGDNAIFDVIDDGPGVGAEEAERIFEPFFRGSAAKGVAGAGLGLAIAREFVLAHGGNLYVLGREGGAHFRAVLPLGMQVE